MPNIMAGSLNGSFGEHSTCTLEVLSLLINNACNLHCKHCYLEAPNSRPHLTPEEWLAFLSSAFSRLRPSVVSFAGKEPFVNLKSASLIFEAVKLRNRIQSDDHRTQLGVITNGTLVHKYAAELVATPPASLVALTDPTLFALPHPQGFAGLAWLKVPKCQVSRKPP